MGALKLKLEPRTGIGSRKVNKLRAQNLLPAVLYKKGEETKEVQVSESDFLRVYKEAGTTSIVELDLDGKIHPSIIKEVQIHPVKNKILHIDFQELIMDEAIRVTIPINLINRDSIRLQPSVLIQMVDEIEIECLPMDIPAAASVDVADMTFAEPIYVRDLDVAKDEKITVLTELDTVVCTLTEPAATVEEEGEGEEAAVEADETEE